MENDMLLPNIAEKEVADISMAMGSMLSRTRAIMKEYDRTEKIDFQAMQDLDESITGLTGLQKWLQSIVTPV